MMGTIADLGPIIQIAFVPRDFDAALAYWTGTMGAGPFFLIEHMPLVDVRYRGRPIEIDSSVALGYWGDMQVELLRQHDDGPSAYREWLDAGREGVHHLCVPVADFAAAHRRLTEMGGAPVHEARMDGAADAAYFELPGPGPMIEIAALAPRFEGLFAYMRNAARGWDGRDPVRALPPESEWAGNN